MYEKISKWYSQGLWSAKMVKDAVNKGVLTEEQAEKIIGEDEDVSVGSQEAIPDALDDGAVSEDPEDEKDEEGPSEGQEEEVTHNEA